jgi:acetyl esterase
MTAYVAPGMQASIDELRAANAPHPKTLPLAVVRQGMEDQAVRWNAYAVPGVTHTDTTIAGRPVRVYQPQDTLATHAMVYLHGGGWTAGSITTHDNMVRRLAAASGMVVLSVDYRLAPEHPAPAAVEDTLAVLDALAQGAGPWKFATPQLCLGGDSAGANVALGALVACKARQSQLPFAALLLYGCFAPVFDTWSNQQYGNGDWGLSTARMEWYWANHLGNLPPDDPVAAPLHADLRGLPFLYITVAGLDPLAEDSFLLARRCIDQGVATIVDPVPGVIHGFGKYAPVVPAAAAALERAGHALRAARHTGENA